MLEVKREEQCFGDLSADTRVPPAAPGWPLPNVRCPRAEGPWSSAVIQSVRDRTCEQRGFPSPAVGPGVSEAGPPGCGEASCGYRMQRAEAGRGEHTIADRVLWEAFRHDTVQGPGVRGGQPCRWAAGAPQGPQGRSESGSGYAVRPGGESGEQEAGHREEVQAEGGGPKKDPE